MKRFYILILLTIFLLSGCSSLPKDYPRTPSIAYKNHKSTKIGRLFEKEAAKLFLRQLCCALYIA